MLILFRYCLWLMVVAPLLLIGPSACKSICEPKILGVWIGSGKVLSKPTNTWIDNPAMAADLQKLIEGRGRRALVYRHDFECSPKPRENCPDCLFCTLDKRGVTGLDCEPDGDLFVRIEIGPGDKVTAAQTYWRR